MEKRVRFPIIGMWYPILINKTFQTPHKEHEYKKVQTLNTLSCTGD